MTSQRAKNISREIFDHRATMSDERYRSLCLELSCVLTKAQLESLAQLVKDGPVWDGDVVSKATRDELLELKLASRAVVKGQEGYTVANYVGVYRHSIGEQD
jgi:hypothetical protein